MLTATQHLIRALRVAGNPNHPVTPDDVTIDFGCGPEGTDFDVGGTISAPDTMVVTCTLGNIWSVTPNNVANHWSAHFAGVTAGTYLLQVTGDGGGKACCWVQVSTGVVAGRKRCKVHIRRTPPHNMAGVPTCSPSSTIAELGLTLDQCGCDARDIGIQFPANLGAPSIIAEGPLVPGHDRVVSCLLNGRRAAMTTHKDERWSATFLHLEPGQYTITVPGVDGKVEELQLTLSTGRASSLE